MESEKINDLRKVIALKDLPDEHLQWILEHSEYKEYEDSELMLRTGEPTEFLGFIFEGRGNFYMDINGKLVFYYTFENNPETGGTSGLLPYSRMTKAPGNIYAVGKVKMFQIHKKYFPELEKLNPELMKRLIGYMTERARIFSTLKIQFEKVSALGNLAAGIAHELNNPASAISRNSDELNRLLKQNYELTEILLMYNISPLLIQNIRGRAEQKRHVQKEKISLIQQMKNEDVISDWLSQNGLDEHRRTAETFAEAGFTKEDIQFILSNSKSDSLVHVLQWLENYLSSQQIISDLSKASLQITNLVTAIKSHVQMDRSNAKQSCNIHNDIENTLILLGYKIRVKNITVEKEFCSDLREVPAYVGELNQVWTNIIDNAIFALEKNGTLTIETTCDKNFVTARIIDNGPGIPKEIISRIFDPFFTTKKVGEGTGIGLDLVSRIITRHNGEVKVNSVPGRTEFIVRIPVVL